MTREAITRDRTLLPRVTLTVEPRMNERLANPASSNERASFAGGRTFSGMGPLETDIHDSQARACRPCHGSPIKALRSNHNSKGRR